MPEVNITPSVELLKALRARLILDDLSLTKWSEAHGIKRQNLRKALVGQWDGPKARNIVRLVCRYLEQEEGQ